VHAVTEAARRASQADAARLLTSTDAGLVVAAVAGSGPDWRQGETVPADSEGVGYVVASAQPLSVAAPHPDGRPSLCVPCTLEGEPIGAIELLGRPGQDAFPIEATEIAMLFGGVAAAALAAGDPAVAGASSPAELAAGLAQLDASDPARYASVARAVNALLS
jgi:hypothetical protein